MRSVAYEPEAEAQATTARACWPRAGDVLDNLEWTLARDADHLGMPLVHGGTQRLAKFRGAVSTGMPTVECIFEVTPQRVIISDLEFY